MFSIVGVMVLVVASAWHADAWKVVSFAIYGLSLINIFVSSAIHHGLHCGPTCNSTLRMLDYVAIYPFIAGTFTPLCLVFLNNSWIGWGFFGIIWVEAIFGMTINIIFYKKIPKWLTLTIYLSMGWTGAFLAMPLFAILGIWGVGLLALGGLSYTVGGGIFIAEAPNPIPGKFGFHEIWHVFVVMGAGLHWALMFFYVLPFDTSKSPLILAL
ncbi:hypothetical protein AAMO2058_000349000 [Amorphochlora amoebiformis]